MSHARQQICGLSGIRVASMHKHALIEDPQSSHHVFGRLRRMTSYPYSIENLIILVEYLGTPVGRLSF